MNTLFDRYFLVLAGRLTPDHWGSVATPVQVGSGVITLGWPPEETENVDHSRTPVEYGGESDPEQEFVMKRVRQVMLVSMAVVALSMAACGKDSSRKPTYPVTGKVVLPGGKSIEHSTVVLHPVDDADPEAVKPRGKVGKDGTFALTTYEGQDGAPAGEYRVTVELWLASGKGDDGPTSRLPAKYARPETSGLTATIAPEPTSLKPIQLKR